MNEPNSAQSAGGSLTAAGSQRSVVTLFVLGVASLAGYATLLRLSESFALEVPRDARAIPTFVLLMGGLFVISVVALRVANRCPDSARVWRAVWMFALAFRVLGLFSEPIQELDFYRYLWDGRTVLEGVNPYRYAPEQLIRASSATPNLPDDLRRLVAIRDSEPTTADVLQRIHFGELPTIYPPVSQAVFAAAALTTPRAASVATRVAVLKSWIVLFDIGTLFILAALLTHTGLPIGWSIAYAWSPLVIKEFANSGHLDSIAVFFMVLAVYAVVRGLFPGSDELRRRPPVSSNSMMWLSLSAVSLALAIGAKLFPAVLIPIFSVSALRRVGSGRAAGLAVVTCALASLFCWPMFAVAVRPEGMDPPPHVSGPAQESLKVFLTQWKMNDLLFNVLESNLEPPTHQPDHVEPWFAVTPPSLRQRTVDAFSGIAGTDPRRAPFLMARALLTLVLLALVLRWSWRAAAEDTAAGWLALAFLTLAWFWILSPTLNPWYWSWALPLVPFARCRAWLAVAGFLPLYYMRFWFADQWPETSVAGTGYVGASFFDYVFVWLEHAPWMIALAVESLKKRGVWNASQTPAAARSIIR